MDEVKDKVKDFIKKINNPFASSTKFKGQGRVLGSSSSSIQKPTNAIENGGQRHRQLSDTKGDFRQRNRGVVKESLEEKLSESLSINETQCKSSDVVGSNSVPDGFDPFQANLSSRRGPKSGTSINMLQCPVCNKWYESEEEISAHIEKCLENGPKELIENDNTDGEDSSAAEDKIRTDARNELANHVAVFLSGQHSNETVEVILKLLRNIVKDRNNEKFRRIRMSNPKIQDTIGMAVGGVELLEFIGFKFQAEGEDVWGVIEMPSEEQMCVITEAIALLELNVPVPLSSSSSLPPLNDQAISTEPQKFDRQVHVFFAAEESMAAKIELPDSFYMLSAAELKREADLKKKRIEESQLLIPKSYREKQSKASRKRYKATIIRIQFPDGVILQGRFLPREPTTALYEFVGSALKEGCLEFELLQPAIPKSHVIPCHAKPGEQMPTLEDEDLVPAALIKFKPIETDSVVFTGLCNDLLAISEPLTSAAFGR